MKAAIADSELIEALAVRVHNLETMLGEAIEDLGCDLDHAVIYCTYCRKTADRAQAVLDADLLEGLTPEAG